MFTVANITDFLEQFAPPSLAAEWDNVGLLLGDRSRAGRAVMTCLTVTPDSAAEADRGRRAAHRHAPPDSVSAGEATYDRHAGRRECCSP